MSELIFKNFKPRCSSLGHIMTNLPIPITEEEINATIRNISDKNRITVLIAHRLSTIMHADKIFVLEQGKIIEQGRHEALLEEKGLYYAMWRQQIGERK